MEATATRHNRETGAEDHTETLIQETDREDAANQATLDARSQEEDATITLQWTKQADGTETARTAHNLYTIQPDA